MAATRGGRGRPPDRPSPGFLVSGDRCSPEPWPRARCRLYLLPITAYPWISIFASGFAKAVIVTIALPGKLSPKISLRTCLLAIADIGHKNGHLYQVRNRATRFAKGRVERFEYLAGLTLKVAGQRLARLVHGSRLSSEPDDPSALGDHGRRITALLCALHLDVVQSLPPLSRVSRPVGRMSRRLRQSSASSFQARLAPLLRRDSRASRPSHNDCNLCRR
jgi:hypothetical protein